MRVPLETRRAIDVHCYVTKERKNTFLVLVEIELDPLASSALRLAVDLDLDL